MTDPVAAAKELLANSELIETVVGVDIADILAGLLAELQASRKDADLGELCENCDAWTGKDNGRVLSTRTDSRNVIRLRSRAAGCRSVENQGVEGGTKPMNNDDTITTIARRAAEKAVEARGVDGISVRRLNELWEQSQVNGRTDDDLYGRLRDQEMDSVVRLEIDRLAELIASVLRESPDWEHTHEHDRKLIARDGWMCEQHPGREWPHDDCASPGQSWRIEGRERIESVLRESDLLAAAREDEREACAKMCDMRGRRLAGTEIRARGRTKKSVN
jgi:hypothetical protein